MHIVANSAEKTNKKKKNFEQTDLSHYVIMS